MAGSDPGFALLSNSWSITTWLQLTSPEGASGTHHFLSSDWLFPGGFTFRIADSGPVQENLIFDFQNVPVVNGISVPLDTPVFIAMVADGAGINGSSNKHQFVMWDGTNWHFREGPNFITPRLQGLEIGSFNGAGRVHGIMDDVRVYGHALAQDNLDFLTLADTDGDGTLDYLDPDDDGDGLKDLDEPPFSTDPKDSNTDGDPVNDGDEFIADTDPTDPNSFWQLTAISNVTSKTIYFESSSNRIYTLQQSVDLRDSTWATVGPEVTDVPGAGGSDSLTDTNDVEASKSYRVIVELP